MNKQGRKKISEISRSLNAIQYTIESLLEEESDKFDNLPDNFQDGEVGEKLQEIIEKLGNVSEAIGESIEIIEQI